MERRISKQVQVAGVPIGGGTQISVQSMLSVHWTDTPGNVQQAMELEKAGCEIIRVALPTREAAKSLVPALKQAVSVPIVGDIHFDYRIALDAADLGIDKIRINPGNIGADQNVRAVAKACQNRGIPIRIGVNSGSVEKDILQKHGGPTPGALCESALYHARLLEQYDFTDIVLSLKASSVDTTIAAYRKIAGECQYPLHLGVTEAGTARMGLVKSAIGIGSLLQQGIGDTIRVSLTAPPVEEVAAAYDILSALELRPGIQLVSCPTCGRTEIDLIGLANAAEKALRGNPRNLTVAIMGCVVNGPGEAREADIGIAGGKGVGILFRKGQVIRKVPEAQLLDALLEELEK